MSPWFGRMGNLCSDYVFKKQKTCTVFLSSFNVTLLAFYHATLLNMYSVTDSKYLSNVPLLTK